MITAGIDAGSRTLKVLLWDSRTQTILATRLCDQSTNQQDRARWLFERLLNEAGIERRQVTAVAATGYGRGLVDISDTTITEITCHAVGTAHLHPQAATVIDIGGQDSKLIRLDEEGKVRDFVMNDRCAAGTGHFLEVVARRLEVPLDKLGDYARRSDAPATISSICVVFAETEIIGLLAQGHWRENIIAGVQNALARRLAAMGGNLVHDPVYLTGGAALVSGMQQALQAALGRAVTVCKRPQFTGALGAAILAARRNAAAFNPSATNKK
jgi:predicted CoA-substrate-specific enzyme activase